MERGRETVCSQECGTHEGRRHRYQIVSHRWPARFPGFGEVDAAETRRKKEAWTSVQRGQSRLLGIVLPAAADYLKHPLFTDSEPGTDL
jgi:hypothetical protein